MNEELEEETIAQIVKESIEHNPRHYIKLKIFGKEICPCARCFGMWTGLIIGFLLSSPFWLGIIRVPDRYFLLIFVIAWLFAVPAIVDWTTTKLKLRKGKNSIRVITGFLHGIGINIYFFILPIDVIFKIVTYVLYEIVFNLIRRRYRIQHYKIKRRSRNYKYPDS